MSDRALTNTLDPASGEHGLVVGVDVGGTKVAAGLVDQCGAILYQTRVPMISDDGAYSALAAVRAAIDSVVAQAGLKLSPQGSVRSIGICSPGPLNPYTGTVVNPPNLPCWRNFPLATEISQIYGVKVSVDNDANAAALAEALWGAGRGYRNVFCTTLGTGIGTGFIMDGHIYHGRTGAAAEGGHVSIDYRGPRCGCGKPGCIEVFASGPAIAKRARTKLAGTPALGPVLLELCGGNLDRVTSEMVGKAYAAGDQLAKQILEETAELLSFWLGNIVDLLEPDIMIVGGGAAPLMQPFLRHIQDRLPACCVNSRCQEIPLVMARYGEDAGIVGGAALCAQRVSLAV